MPNENNYQPVSPKRHPIFLFILLILVMGAAGYFAYKYYEVTNLTNGTGASLQAELAELQERYDDLESSYNRIPEGSVSYKDSVINQFMDDFMNYKFIIRISTDRYLFYKAKPHHIEDRSDYVNYVTFGDKKIIALVEQIKSYLPRGHTELDYANALHLLIHKYPHETDIDNYPKFALETIAEASGDCEDLAILLATFMKAAGFDTVLLVWPERHMAVGANIKGASGNYYTYNGKKYHYMEATGTTWPDEPTQWPIGEMPKKYMEEAPEIYEV